MEKKKRNAHVFESIKDFINRHVGEEVKAQDIMCGKEFGKNAETTNLYKLIRLKYVVAVEKEGCVKDEGRMFRICKPLPEDYDTASLRRENRILSGFIP